METTFARIERKKVVRGQLVKLEFKLESLGQSPYFSITGDVYDKQQGTTFWLREPSSCGQVQHEYVGDFPEVAEYNKWHGSHINRGPWYYYANTEFWFKYYTAGAKYDYSGKVLEQDAATCLRYAAETCVWGALPGEDSDFADAVAKHGGLGSLLQSRHARLIDCFHGAMVTLFGFDAIQKAIDYANTLTNNKEEHHAVSST